MESGRREVQRTRAAETERDRGKDAKDIYMRRSVSNLNLHLTNDYSIIH